MNEETKTQEEECDGAENSEARKTVEKLGAVTDKRFACITIIGQVEGHYILDSSQKATKYEHLIPLLVAFKEYSVYHIK